MTSTARTDLRGLCVLVTRPAVQGRTLVDAIREAGGRPIALPMLEIEPIEASPELLSQVRHRARCDWSVFISVNAVEHGLRLLSAAGAHLGDARVASIGRATSAALQAAGVHVDLDCPAPAGSESLLATPEMHAVQGWRIVVFRGRGGRELLGTTLRSRGARVDYIECYRRVQPDPDPDTVRRVAGESVDVIITTSVDGLRNLMHMIRSEGLEPLLDATLLVAGERQRSRARCIGWPGRVAAAADAGDRAFLDKLRELPVG